MKPSFILAASCVLLLAHDVSAQSFTKAKRVRIRPPAAFRLNDGPVAATVVLNSGTLNLHDNGAGNDGVIAIGDDVSVTGTPVGIDVNNAGANTGNTIQLGTLSIGAHALTISGGNGYRLAFTGATTLLGTPTFNVTTADFTLGGPVGGSFGFTKTGAGKLTLGAANTYTGNTAINAGTVQYNDPVVNAAAAGTINANFGATVAAGFPITQAFLTRVNSGSSGVVALAADSAANLNLPAANLNNVRLGAVGAATLGGTIAPVGTQYRLGGGGGTLTLSATNVLTGNNNLDLGVNCTIAGVIALTADNNFTGQINLREGMLLRPLTNASLGAAGNLITGDGGGIQFAAGAPFDLFASRTVTFGGNGFIFHTNGSDFTPSGAITSSGGGPFIKDGAGVLTLVAPNAYSGATHFRGGVISVDADAKFGASNNFTFSGGTLRWTGPNGTISRGGNFLDVVNAANFEVATPGSVLTLNSGYGGGGVGKVTFTKTGPGTLALNGGSSYAGHVVVNEGTLQIISGGPDGTMGNGAKLIIVRNGAAFSLTGASYDPGGNTKFFSIGPGGGVINIGTNLTLALNDGPNGDGIGTDASQLQGSGTLTKTGPGVLELGNTNSANYNYANFTGEIIVAQGVVRLRGSSSPLGASSAGTTVLAGGAIEAEGNPGVEPIAINGNGTGNGAISVVTAATATFDGPITVASAASVGSTTNSPLIFNGPIGGSADLTKVATGGGGVTFTAPNPLTGNLRVAGGVAALAGPNGSFLNVPGIFALTSGVFLLNNDGGANVTVSNNSNRFADTTPVSLAHGVIELRAMQAASGESTETLGPVTTSGHSVLKISRLGGSANAALSAQSLTRFDRGVTRLQPAAAGTLGGLDKFFILNNPPVPVNGMVTPWIVNDTERTFVTYGANGFANAAFTATDPNAATATDIVDASGGITLAPNRTVYAMRMGGGSLATPETLTVAGGGLIFTATATQVASFAFPAGVEGLLYNASGTTLTLNGSFTAPAGLTKFGTGTVLMRSTNTSGLASPITATGGVLSFGIDNTAANDQGYFPATGFLQANGGGTANFFPSLTIGGLGGAGIVMWGNTAAPVKREITLATQDENIFRGTLQRNSIAGTAGGGTTAGEALFTKAGAGHLRLDGAFLNGIREFKVHAGKVTFSENARWTPQNERGRLVVNQGAEVTIDNSVVNIPDRLALDYNSNSEAGGAFRLAGGTCRFIGNAAANSSETVNRLPATVTVANFRPTFGPGTDLIEITPGAGRAATLTFITNSGATDLSFVREAGASVFIEGKNLGGAQGAADTANLLFTSAPSLTGFNNGTGVRGTPQVGVIKGVVVRSTPAVGEGGTHGVATYDPGGDGIFGNGDDLGVRRLLASELDPMIADGDTVTLANVLLASTTQTLTSPSAVNSLHLRGGTVLGTTALSVASGMILSEAGTANTIGVGMLDFGSGEGLFTSSSAIPLTVNSQITGSAGLTVGGFGEVRLNNAGNTFSGPITVNSAAILVQDNGGLGAAANPIVLNNSARLLSNGNVTLDDGAGVRRAITLGGPGAQLTALSGSLTVSGIISGGVSTLSGLIPSQTTALDLAGLGTITLTGANTYTGRTDVRGGTRIVGDGTSGSLVGNVRVMQGGRLGGLGTIGGEVAVESGGALDPGTAISAGTLSVGGLRMINGAALALRLNSTAAFDQLNVTGSVSLTGDVELSLSLGFDPQDNVDSFLIVQNDGTDPVTGVFYVGGIPIGDGDSFLAGGQYFRLRYTLGTGNDVVLLAVPEPGVAGVLGASVALVAGLGRRRRSI